MSQSTLYPKGRAPLNGETGPLFFLAGPVGGADDWQSTCFDLLSKRLERFIAAIPWPWNRDHDLHHLQMNADGQFKYQLDWERHYLDGAALTSHPGCIIFWLPKESESNPRVGGNYARDTRGELGEWRGILRYRPDARVVVGGQEGFSGLDIIERNFRAVLPGFTLHRSLEETVDAAITKSGWQPAVKILSAAA